MKPHSTRKHSKFAASSAERYFECSASVDLCEGLPDKDTVWSLEGTKAHELLEKILLSKDRLSHGDEYNAEMYFIVRDCADFIFSLHEKTPHSTLNAEERIYLDFIHPDAFGTYDAAVVEPFGTLHVIDFKYGAGVPVTPEKNLQLIFYGLGVAHKYHFNFQKVRLWIIQPRIKGYDGPVFWKISIGELKAYIPLFKDAVRKVQNEPVFKEGSWCHWCKAKGICPLKQDRKLDQARSLFSCAPFPDCNARKKPLSF